MQYMIAKQMLVNTNDFTVVNVLTDFLETSVLSSVMSIFLLLEVC